MFHSLSDVQIKNWFREVEVDVFAIVGGKH